MRAHYTKRCPVVDDTEFWVNEGHYTAMTMSLSKKQRWIVPASFVFFLSLILGIAVLSYPDAAPRARRSSDVPRRSSPEERLYLPELSIERQPVPIATNETRLVVRAKEGEHAVLPDVRICLAVGVQRFIKEKMPVIGITDSNGVVPIPSSVTAESGPEDCLVAATDGCVPLTLPIRALQSPETTIYLEQGHTLRVRIVDDASVPISHMPIALSRLHIRSDQLMEDIVALKSEALQSEPVHPVHGIRVRVSDDSGLAVFHGLAPGMYRAALLSEDYAWMPDSERQWITVPCPEMEMRVTRPYAVGILPEDDDDTVVAFSFTMTPAVMDMGEGLACKEATRKRIEAAFPRARSFLAYCRDSGSPICSAHALLRKSGWWRGDLPMRSIASTCTPSEMPVTKIRGAGSRCDFAKVRIVLVDADGLEFGDASEIRLRLQDAEKGSDGVGFTVRAGEIAELPVAAYRLGIANEPVLSRCLPKSLTVDLPKMGEDVSTIALKVQQVWSRVEVSVIGDDLQRIPDAQLLLSNMSAPVSGNARVTVNSDPMPMHLPNGICDISAVAWGRTRVARRVLVDANLHVLRLSLTRSGG